MDDSSSQQVDRQHHHNRHHHQQGEEQGEHNDITQHPMSPRRNAAPKDIDSTAVIFLELQRLLREIEQQTLQLRIRKAVDALIAAWSSKQENLLDRIDILEATANLMEQRLDSSSMRYHKAVREMQFYKSKLERAHAQIRRLSIFDENLIIPPPRASSLSSRGSTNNNYRPMTTTTTSSSSGTNRDSCLSSCASSSLSSISLHGRRSSLGSLSFGGMDSLDEQENLRSFTSDAVVADDHFDLVSVLALAEKTTIVVDPVNAQPLPPPTSKPPAPPSPQQPSSTATRPSSPSNRTPEGNTTDDDPGVSSCTLVPSSATANSSTTRTQELTFACGEGFWDSIARGKNRKDEVDTLVRNYLRRGGQPNVAKNSPSLKSVKEGYGLLHALIAIMNSRAIARVIEAGANPNTVTLSSGDEDRVTPLVLAASLGYMTGVQLLVERAQADLYQRGPCQETALHAAIKADAADVVLYLLQVSNNALLDIVDVSGATPLHYACKFGKARFVTLLIRQCRVKSDPRDNKGETPLHYAVRHQRSKIVAKLVGELGVYPNPYISKQVPTPLDLAKQGGLKSIAKYLREMGAKTTKEMEKTNSGYKNILASKRSSGNMSSSVTTSTSSNHYPAVNDISAINMVTTASTYTSSSATSSGIASNRSSDSGGSRNFLRNRLDSLVSFGSG